MTSLLASSKSFSVSKLRLRALPPIRFTFRINSRNFHSDAPLKGQAGLAFSPAPIQHPIPFPTIAKSSIKRSDQVQNVPLGSTDDVLTPSILVEPGDRTLVAVDSATIPIYHRGSKFERVPYWQNIPRWKDVTEKQWLSYRWGTANDIQGKIKLLSFLESVLPDELQPCAELPNILTRKDFIEDVMTGIAKAPMSIRLPPHICASINWTDALNDPLRRQYIPMSSAFQIDHPMLTLDSLHETADSTVPGLVHRYTDKCLFLASSHCPLYCRFCTRSYAVGADTESVTKASLKPQRARWQAMVDYIARTPVINDVVLSGGDSYSLQPQHLRMICDKLLDIPHIRRIRVATKGICVAPNRTLDPDDSWTDEMIQIAKTARERGKAVAIHTHFNHPNEFSWVTREAAQKLFANGVTVRNQSVLLRGVNDTVETMSALIRELADNNIVPYYVYSGDLVEGVEDLRTPLHKILDIEANIRGSIAGFMTPQFIVDLPGGGGKRLAGSFLSYDRTTGESTFMAPAVKGRDKENKIYSYYDPLASLTAEAREAWLKMSKAPASS